MSSKRVHSRWSVMAAASDWGKSLSQALTEESAACMSTLQAAKALIRRSVKTGCTRVVRRHCTGARIAEPSLEGDEGANLRAALEGYPYTRFHAAEPWWWE